MMNEPIVTVIISHQDKIREHKQKLRKAIQYYEQPKNKDSEIKFGKIFQIKVVSATTTELSNNRIATTLVLERF